MRIRARSRSEATLLSGTATAPCALGRWMIDPHGDPPLESIDPANVLTWEIPNLPGNELVLKRQPLPGGSLQVKTFTLSATQGRIELLIVHVPTEEFKELLGAKPGTGSGGPQGEINKDEIDRHLAEFYKLIEAPRDQWAFTTSVQPTGNICRIKVLGLENAVYPLLDKSRSRVAPQAIDGIRTYSCVIGSAESS